eukprot:12215037-Prorocentrum_lima.AAC.1
MTSKRTSAKGASTRAMGEAIALIARYVLLFGFLFSGLTWYVQGAAAARGLRWPVTSLTAVSTGQ